VHLEDWPAAGNRDIRLEEDMAVARGAVSLGLRARAAAKVKLRQPLREAVVVAAGRERDALERLADVVRDELNVKALRFVEAADELGSYDLKPNYRSLGPRFGKAMPQVVAAVAALDPAGAAEALRDGRPVGIAVDGHEHMLTPDDLSLVMQPLEGYQLEREGSHAVALELALDHELRREGLAREVVRAVQNARKAAGLAVEDRIRLVLGGDDELVGAARAHEGYVAGEVLAVEVAYDGAHDGDSATIEGRELRIAVARASSPSRS
jgi:isoleucyl-tRNA synthetase